MQLMSETANARTYFNPESGYWYEVRKELMAKSYPLEEWHYIAFEQDPTRTVPNHPELEAVITRCSLDLRVWFMEHEDLDPASAQAVAYSSETYTREELARFKFDPADFEPNVSYRIVMVEQAFWPPAPVDPTPEEPTPPPRRSDFRGDRLK